MSNIPFPRTTFSTAALLDSWLTTSGWNVLQLAVLQNDNDDLRGNFKLQASYNLPNTALLPNINQIEFNDVRGLPATLILNIFGVSAVAVSFDLTIDVGSGVTQLYNSGLTVRYTLLVQLMQGWGLLLSNLPQPADLSLVSSGMDTGWKG